VGRIGESKKGGPQKGVANVTWGETGMIDNKDSVGKKGEGAGP